VVEDDNTARIGVGGIAGKPVVRRVPLDGAASVKDTIGKLADELEGYEDLHASAQLRRDLLRNLAPVVIEEALACAA
jgi:2-furoyl-CoA dehydrogenase FAD binding subunit